MSAEPVHVDTARALEALVAQLGAAPRFALDTEGNSFHAYRDRVCLIQVGLPDAEFIVDPLAVDVRPLGPVLASGRAEVVIHGGDYDVRGLKRDFGLAIGRLFDTEVAARVLGWPATSLSALVRERFGIELGKAPQLSDWGRRPLADAQLAYAALDVRYVLPLREALGAELASRGLEAQAAQAFARLAAVEPRPRAFDPEGWRKIAGARNLDASGSAVLRKLYRAREERASAIDRPPFKVVGNEALVEIARRRPVDLAALQTIRGVSPRVAARVGKLLLDAVRRASPPGPHQPGSRTAPADEPVIEGTRPSGKSRSRSGD